MSRPHPVLRLTLAAAVAVICVAAEQMPPPRPLPPSVGKQDPAPPGSPVTPASARDTKAVAPPISRFKDLQAFPTETVQAIYSVQAGAEWLWRMNQTNGRFFPGIHPALRLPVEGDDDLRQAHAALALAEAARFTGEERYTARAAQAVLALLALTRTDPALPGQRIPVAPSAQCNRVAFASLTILAIHALPDPGPLQHGEAEELAAFLVSRVRADGSIQLGDTPEKEASPPGPYPGLAIQALVASYRSKPDEAKRATLSRVVGHYREMFKSRPDAAMAITMIPALAELALMSNGDTALTAAVFEMADHVCRCQFTRNDTRNPLWIGGFRSDPSTPATEPGIDSARAVAAIAAAIPLTRRAPDVVRFRTYRQAVVAGMVFVRGLQFNSGSVDHFEKAFRTQFLVGAGHTSPTNGTVRVDATAMLVSCQLRFLHSGAEQAPE